MYDSLQAPLAFGLIAAFVTSIGLIAVATREDWSQRHAGLFGLAAAGMLLTLTLTHIAPNAAATTENAPQFLLAGFLGGVILAFLIRAMFPSSESGSYLSEAFTPIAAIACHSFIDGIIYTVTFAADAESGVYTALSLIIHEFPEGRDCVRNPSRAWRRQSAVLLLRFLRGSADNASWGACGRSGREPARCRNREFSVRALRWALAVCRDGASYDTATTRAAQTRTHSALIGRCDRALIVYLTVSRWAWRPS